jgi:hypothetical protein
MSISNFRSRWPGLLAAGFVLLTTVLWTFWGISELYYEGWGLPFPAPLSYLIPAALCLIFSLLALRWPRLGGWVLIVCGTAFTAWWLNLSIQRSGGFSWQTAISQFPFSTLLILTGVLFLLEGRNRRRRRAAGWTPSPVWWRRSLAYLLTAGLPLLVILVVSAFQLPGILGRYDDGGRGERRITADGVDLVWAPLGPGWNWRQAWGGYPSWNMLALYGREPVGLDGKSSLPARPADMQATGLCAYLSADGLTLTDTPQNIWRMPTVDELARSLTRDGKSANCTWQGGVGQLTCSLTPDKETPLWNPDAPPIYYWAANELDERDAYYISYNGFVSTQPKTFGNPRHGYRCVRSP